MGSETLPSALYILSDEPSIPFYSTSIGYKNSGEWVANNSKKSEIWSCGNPRRQISRKIFSLWVTDKLKNELRILIRSSREFRSANKTRDERPLVRWVYGCLSLTKGCVKWCAPHLCDCHLPCDIAKSSRARNTKLKNYFMNWTFVRPFRTSRVSFFILTVFITNTAKILPKRVRQYVCTYICMCDCKWREARV